MPGVQPQERDPADAGSPGAGGAGADAHELTEVVTRLRRALRASIRTDIPWEAFPMAQVELLQTLTELTPARVGDLAERLHLAKSTVSGLIAQSITNGYVTRETDPDDRRAAVVTLTAAGRSRLAEWEQAHERRIARAFELLRSTDRQAIRRALPALSHLTRQLNEG